jgi:hypothetical protein
MNYSQLIQLGFRRREFMDEVHFNIYGYNAFDLYKKLGRKHALVWEPTQRDEVELQLLGDIYILKRWSIKDLDTVAMLVNMFG